LSASIGAPFTMFDVDGDVFIMPRFVLLHGMVPAVLPVVVRGVVPVAVPFVVVVVDVVPLVCVAVVVVPFVVTVVLFVVPAAVFVDVVGTVPVDVVPLQFVIVEFGIVAGVPGVVCETAGSVRLASSPARDATPSSGARELMLWDYPRPRPVLAYLQLALKLSCDAVIVPLALTV
jgi:hypothetical protein